VKIERFLILFVFLVGCQLSTFSQDRSEIVQQRIEFISEQLGSEDIDLTNIIEQLYFYYDNPLNLNSATSADLEEINLLTSIQINDLILHRKLFGNFISIYELQTLKYWDLSTIQLVLPFVRVDDKLDNLHVSLKEALKQGDYEVFLRYQRIPEERTGYDNVPDSVLSNSNSYYYGSPDRYYTRLRYSYRTNISIGVTGEKDAGEQFFQGAQKSGFDFYSFHAFYKGGKYLKAVAIGDYQIQIGQGLNLWSGYAFGKTADVTNVKRSANPIKSYTSVDESRFLRGAAFDLGWKDFSFTGFASAKKVDASGIADSLFDDLQYVTSINLSGLHRTNSEIERRDVLTEYITGGNLRYATRGLQLGLAGVYQGYDKEFNKAIQPYNQFDFRGKDMYSLSGDYSWVIQNFNFFGETSWSSFNGSWAHLHGFLASIDTRASLSVIYRNYGRGYQTFYNNGFSEGSNTQNENGLYAGLKVKFSPFWTFNGYVDFFKFPWLKYQIDGPSQGNERLAQLSYKPTKTFEIYARYRYQNKQRNSRFSDGTVTALENVVQQNYRINVSYAVNEFFTLKSRIEWVSIQRPSQPFEKGILITQDLLFKPKSLPFDLSLRYALFDTDSYDTRIYSFENNALYAFAVPAHYYQGNRAYVLLRYSFLNYFDLWVRYGVFIYNNRTSIGSGAEEIIGDKKSDLTIQLRMSF
jgi:hypothetical protein